VTSRLQLGTLNPMEIDSRVVHHDQTSSEPQLKRHIGLLALTLYGIGDILGAGIYGLIGRAAGQMGNAIWLAFLASMIAAGLTGLSYAAVGSRFPRAGGAAYVTQRAFKKTWLAYIVGLAALASGLTSMATASRVFSGYLQGMFPSIPLWVLIVGFATLLAGIVFRGIRESMWANSVCTVIELSGLLIIIVFGMSYLGGVDYFDASVPVTNPDGLITTSLILGGAVLTFYSFVGFEDVLNVSEEVKDPARTIPRGLIFAVAGASIIYVLISLIAVSVVPAAQLAESKEPLVDVVRTAAPWFPPKLYSIMALFAVSNTALLNYVMGSRLLYGMSKQKLLPSFLSKVHGKTATPHIAVAVLYVILLGLALSGDISSLAKSTSVLLLGCFVLVNSALIVLKRREPTPKGAFDVPYFVPALGVIACLAMLAHAKQPELITAGLILAGIIILYFVKRPGAEAIEKIDAID
jgi:APA family basic amino acid/polyamine antiporter